MKKFLKRLLGTGLLLLNHPDRVKKTVIDRADDHLDDLGDLAQEKYQPVADIVALHAPYEADHPRADDMTPVSLLAP